MGHITTLICLKFGFVTYVLFYFVWKDEQLLSFCLYFEGFSIQLERCFVTPIFRADHPFFFMIHDTQTEYHVFNGSFKGTLSNILKA